MSARFKIVLFVAMAAGIGLHLRPCIGCVIGEWLGAGDRCEAPEPAPEAVLDGSATLAAAAPAAAIRPGLSAFHPDARVLGGTR